MAEATLFTYGKLWTAIATLTVFLVLLGLTALRYLDVKSLVVIAYSIIPLLVITYIIRLIGRVNRYVKSMNEYVRQTNERLTRIEDRLQRIEGTSHR